MRVDNPFYVYEHVRYSCKPSGVVGVVGFHCRELDVPEDTEEVLIEVVNKGRSDAEQVYAARIWSKNFGELDVESHEKKVQVEKEVAEMEAKMKSQKKKANRVRDIPEVKTEPEAAVITKEAEDKALVKAEDAKWEQSKELTPQEIAPVEIKEKEVEPVITEAMENISSAMEKGIDLGEDQKL